MAASDARGYSRVPAPACSFHAQDPEQRQVKLTTRRSLQVSGRSPEVSAGHGPGGNPSCWNDAFSYDPCCTQVGEPPGRPGPLRCAGEREVLERSFGTKLDAVLAQNGLGLAGLEADLMHSLRVPET
ncbi:unnamed protein product, partial [Prorocentrum cordatum]